MIIYWFISVWLVCHSGHSRWFHPWRVYWNCQAASTRPIWPKSVLVLHIRPGLNCLLLTSNHSQFWFLLWNILNMNVISIQACGLTLMRKLLAMKRDSSMIFDKQVNVVWDLHKWKDELTPCKKGRQKNVEFRHVIIRHRKMVLVQTCKPIKKHQVCHIFCKCFVSKRNYIRKSWQIMAKNIGCALKMKMKPKHKK